MYSDITNINLKKKKCCPTIAFHIISQTVGISVKRYWTQTMCLCIVVEYSSYLDTI